MKDNTGDGSMRWLNKSIEMNEAAKLVHEKDSNFLASVLLMLEGYSIELALKAIYALEENSRPIQYKHGIARLAKDLKIGLSQFEHEFVEVLQEYVIWAGRYPETMKHSQADYDLLDNKTSKVFWKKGKLGKMNILTPSEVNSFCVYESIFEKVITRYNVSYMKNKPG